MPLKPLDRHYWRNERICFSDGSELLSLAELLKTLGCSRISRFKISLDDSTTVVRTARSRIAPNGEYNTVKVNGRGITYRTSFHIVPQIPARWLPVSTRRKHPMQGIPALLWSAHIDWTCLEPQTFCTSSAFLWKACMSVRLRNKLVDDQVSPLTFLSALHFHVLRFFQAR